MIYLTNCEKVKSIVNIDDNIDEKYLATAIKETQDIYLRDILGDLLLDKIISLVEDETISQEANAAYKDLLNQAQYYLAYQAACQVIFIASIKINNFGATQASDEHLTNLNLNDVFKLTDTYQQKADYYKFLLQNYICQNRTKLPEVTMAQMFKIHSNLFSAASSNIWLGGYRGKRIISPRGEWWDYRWK